MSNSIALWIGDGATSRNFRFSDKRMLGYLAAFAFAALLYNGDGAQAADRPNIILILADDVGYGDLSVYNPDTPLNLPTLERLASEGLRFNDAHTSASKCAPSRYSIITGNYQWRGKNPFGQWNYKNGSQILSGQETLGDILSQAGYVTAMFGKYHLGGDFFLKGSNQFANGKAPDDQVDFSRPMVSGASERGFDYSFLALRGIQGSPYAFFENDHLIDPVEDLIHWPEGDYGDTAIVSSGIGSQWWNTRDVGPRLLSAATKFIDDHLGSSEAGSPFFIYFNTEAVHSPRKPPTAIADRPVLGASGLDDRADMLVEIDVVLEQLLASLDKYEIAENTMIIFTSDNGGLPTRPALLAGHDPAGGLRGSKGQIYEGGHRVPLVVKWGHDGFQGSSLRGGTEISGLVGIQDLFATLAELVGVVPSEDQGRDSVSILPLLLGSTDQSPRNHMIQQSDTYEDKTKAHQFAYRSGSWKLILDAQHVPMELYDLATDIKEERDLIDLAEHAGRIEDMASEFRAALVADRTTPPAGRDNQAPDLTNPGDQINAEGDHVDLLLVVSDPENDPLSFSAAGLPPDLAINPTTGLISGTLRPDTVGQYEVSIVVSDGRESANVAFTWTVTASSGRMTLDYPDFSQVDGWQFNGSAAPTDGVLRLTPATRQLAGSVFYATPLSIAADTSFSTRFDFRIHGNIDGADGMTFMIQGNAPSSLGRSASGLGYAGVPASLAVEIDTYSGDKDPDGNHLAVLVKGRVGSHRAIHSPSFDLADGAPHTLWIDYTAATRTLAVYLARDPGEPKPTTPVMTDVVNLSALVGTQPYVGFSAGTGTGGLSNNHDILNLTFINENESSL